MAGRLQDYAKVPEELKAYLRVFIKNKLIYQMADYLVSGGKRLSGSVMVNPSKNGAVAILIASLLNEKKTTIENLPKIEEVFRIIEVLKSIGVKVNWLDNKKTQYGGHAVEIIPPKKIGINNIDKEAAGMTRSIILFAGALANSFSKFSLPASGGCKLGKRSIMPHIYTLEEFGMKTKISPSGYIFKSEKISPVSNLILYEAGDTVTENAIMIASLAPGKTVIRFASANYQVQDLCFFLKKLGVKIEGVGTSTLAVYGKKKISKEISYALSEDPIEAMLFISISITTMSSITIERCPIDFLELELLKLKKMGFQFKILREYKARNGYTRLVDIRTLPSKLNAPEEKISAMPYPGINIDNLPFFAVIAMKSKGETLIHDWTYENRAVYLLELSRLGARVTLADPHRVFIEGPSKLTATDMVCPPALRPSTIILAAILGAKGRSLLSNIYSIERGHEDLCGRLLKLGAGIRKIENTENN
ncbi:MAG: UDP-N-acetylglucosamine 1-carboxyvinyltransferase [Parcubacteria group bacterium]|nr:UDP-N-acetylglucosamine 1-carboxyvinyltransferase [Parcubacteria group bacterium]MCR4342850.1 UDP-N-acetylglucosamine 1-carboxyvinyltransferase [Patescibacteria group bacterium]